MGTVSISIATKDFAGFQVQHVSEVHRPTPLRHGHVHVPVGIILCTPPAGLLVALGLVSICRKVMYA